MNNLKDTMVAVTEDNLLLGSCVYYPRLQGWRFIPAVASRKPSSKVWGTARECIPGWATEQMAKMMLAANFRKEMAQPRAYA